MLKREILFDTAGWEEIRLGAHRRMSEMSALRMENTHTRLLSLTVMTMSGLLPFATVVFLRGACLFLRRLCVAGPDPATSAQVDGEVTLSLPRSARCAAAVFSSQPLFVSAWCPEVKPSVSGSLEIPVPTLLRFAATRWGGPGCPTAASVSGFLLGILKTEANRLLISRERHNVLIDQTFFPRWQQMLNIHVYHGEI